jgi:hypothetical protein
MKLLSEYFSEDNMKYAKVYVKEQNSFYVVMGDIGGSQSNERFYNEEDAEICAEDYVL